MRGFQRLPLRQNNEAKKQPAINEAGIIKKLNTFDKTKNMLSLLVVAL